MVSPEFKAVISKKNLLRVRIMLKDSFVVDPTFVQLDEMLSYAKNNLPGLLVPYDGGYLENDSLKWDCDMMNEELVQLVTNFSEARINHLKKVVAKVMAAKAKETKTRRMEENGQRFHSRGSTSEFAARPWKEMIGNVHSTKEFARHNALKELMSQARKINRIMFEVESNNAWKPYNIHEMEQAAEAILMAVQDYEDNR